MPPLKRCEPQNIERFVGALRQLFYAHHAAGSDQRMGQAIYNAVGPDPFNVEDERFIELIEAELSRFKVTGGAVTVCQHPGVFRGEQCGKCGDVC